MRPLAVLLCVLAFFVSVSRAEDRSLPELRRQLMFAQSDEQADKALDALTERIGKPDGFKDHGAFGDWLGALPSGRAKHPRVRQRQGWAYVVAKRPLDAVAPLEAALKDEPGSGSTRAYLGEALRQNARFDEAIRMLATAVRAGYDEPHVQESVTEAAVAQRRAEMNAIGDVEGLPPYVLAVQAFLAARSDRLLHVALADWLLSDLTFFDKPDTDRGKLWARTAAQHALVGLRAPGDRIAGGARVALMAADALETQDRALEGRTERFDLLVLACRLGQDPNVDRHAHPRAFVSLGEAAADEGRYELAHRMARKRLEISYSPRAVRLLGRLPPDLGED